MKLLVASARTDEWDDVLDFDDGISVGELLEPDFLCDKDRLIQWPGGCGCGRAWVGMSSNKRTTTAVVADVDITIDQLRQLVTDQHLGAEPDDAAEMADDLIGFAEEFNIGQIVYVWRYQPEIRNYHPKDGE